MVRWRVSPFFFRKSRPSRNTDSDLTLILAWYRALVLVPGECIHDLKMGFSNTYHLLRSLNGPEPRLDQARMGSQRPPTTCTTPLDPRASSGGLALDAGSQGVEPSKALSSCEVSFRQSGIARALNLSGWKQRRVRESRRRGMVLKGAMLESG